ncbi:MAG TPA: glutamate--tRNA ligase [Syntrophomonas sp.]|nr:glutamate--tRNA ligase [Syntrophomonas sp.]
MEKIRVRFAPSPTGTLHIGGARTALFNWLYARSQKGTLVLRLEDTDLGRSTTESALDIVDGLRWLGLDWDEGPDIGGSYGPYRQSERLSIYQDYLLQLLAAGKAYYCFCTPDELRFQRENAQASNGAYRYEGTCRNLSQVEVAQRIALGQKPTLRFKMPELGTTVVQDLVRGEVTFQNDLFDDFIIAKSDGWPTYNFAVVVDDHSMKISHVIRAEEHLPNTPKQILLYQALGLTPPQFAHVSMILAPDRSKLSKRHGATSVQEFREQGYLPDALVNYLALLGWSPGDELDIMPIEEMVRRFDLNNVSKSAAIYDIEKLGWMNGRYLGQLNTEDIVAMIENDGRERGWLKLDNRDYFVRVIDLLRSRVKIVQDLLPSAEYFFAPPGHYDEKGVDKYFRKLGSGDKLAAVRSLLDIQPFTAEQIENLIRSKADQLGLKAADLIHPTRLALSGRTNTPGLFEIMELLGSATCIGRLGRAEEYVKTLN